jgi:hypothetical protein
MGGALWRYGTQEEGYTNHSFIRAFKLSRSIPLATHYTQCIC